MSRGLTAPWHLFWEKRNGHVISNTYNERLYSSSLDIPKIHLRQQLGLLVSLFTVRNLSDDLHRRLRIISDFENKTMNTVVLCAIQKHVEELEEKYNLNYGGNSVTRSKTDK